MSSQLFIPPAYPDDSKAKPEQMEAVTEFYQKTHFAELSRDQATILLDYRDYALAVVLRQAKDLRHVEARPFAEDVAIFISRSRERAEAVTAFMRRRFISCASPDGLARAIPRVEFYDDIAAYCEDLDPRR